MSEKKAGGFIFRFYTTDHRPYHLHIYKDRKFLRKYDIENKKLDLKPMYLSKKHKILNALKKLGYLAK